MSTFTEARYLSSISYLRDALAEKQRHFPTPATPGTYSAKAERLLNERIARLWAELIETARAYPQEERRAAA